MIICGTARRGCTDHAHSPQPTPHSAPPSSMCCLQTSFGDRGLLRMWRSSTGLVPAPGGALDAGLRRSAHGKKVRTDKCKCFLAVVPYTDTYYGSTRQGFGRNLSALYAEDSACQKSRLQCAALSKLLCTAQSACAAPVHMCACSGNAAAMCSAQRALGYSLQRA